MVSVYDALIPKWKHEISNLKCMSVWFQRKSAKERCAVLAQNLLSHHTSGSPRCSPPPPGLPLPFCAPEKTAQPRNAALSGLTGGGFPSRRGVRDQRPLQATERLCNLRERSGLRCVSEGREPGRPTIVRDVQTQDRGFVFGVEQQLCCERLHRHGPESVEIRWERRVAGAFRDGAVDPGRRRGSMSG